MASPLVVANNVASQLVANIGPSDTALLVAAGQGIRFPVITAGQYYYATLLHYATGAIEVVKVTSRAADTLTVVRGQDGTTAISFITGSIIELRANAQVLREIDWRSQAAGPGGLVQLDGAGFIPEGQIPASITRDTELAAALGALPPALGFTPVQQGTGIAQLTNVIKIGWKSGGKLGLTVDTTDIGNFLFESARGAANGVASLDAGSLIPIAQIPALGYLPTAGGVMTGDITSNSDISTSGGFQTALEFRSSGSIVVLGTTTPGAVYLRPNGMGTATGQMQLAASGVASATNFSATSDQRLKWDIRTVEPRAAKLDLIEFCSFIWNSTGIHDRGVIAQQVQELFPEYVHEDGDGMLSVDKASLALEAVLGLLHRVQRLEAKRG